MFDEIMAYVGDNAHRVHLNELVTHVRTALRDELEISMGREQIREHFLSHQCDQRIVLNTVLRDLVDIVGVAKNNCVITNDDGAQAMDPKNTGVYIDAVRQLMCIYKQLETTTRKQ